MAVDVVAAAVLPERWAGVFKFSLAITTVNQAFTCDTTHS